MMTATGCSGKILLIDRSRDARMALGMVLSERGFAVLAAPDGFDALAEIAAFQPDIVILDWQAPVVSGRASQRTLRTDYRLTTPVVVVSRVEGTRDEAIAAGADGLWRKPFAPADLLARVALLIEAGRSRADTGDTAAGTPLAG